MHLNSVEALREHMAAVGGKPVSNDDMMWFVCMHRAGMYFDCGEVKSLADLILNGCQPTTFEDVIEWIEVQYEDAYEDDEESMEYATDIVKEIVNQFYGR